MMMKSILLLTTIFVIAQAKVGFFRNPVHPSETYESIGEEPLILSDIADPKEAREASRVYGNGLDRAPSYSGFFTTDDAAKNEMFFWYFEQYEDRDKDPQDVPLLIWLQGGPGGSSMFGAFAEMGPYSIEKNGTDYVAVDRPVSWNDKYAMLFIDNPVGAGFSKTENNGYCEDTKECVSRNLYSLLQQFYRVFPEKANAALYITGESYGGHYVPGFAYYIHEKNKNISDGNIFVNLAGIAVGDGWIDPINMINAYPDLMYNTGLIGKSEKDTIGKMCEQTTDLIRQGKFRAAFDIWDAMLNGDVFPYGNLFHNMTGLNDYDNYLNTNAPESFGYYANYLNQPQIRAAIHVGNSPFPFNPNQCEMHLLNDFMVSFAEELGVLMDNYKVLVYSGQLDVIIGSALTEAFLPFVQWKSQVALKMAPRIVWRISDFDTEVAGYVTAVDKFTFTVVRGAGHILPADQPERSRDMIRRFIQEIPYENLPNPLKPQES